MGCHPVHKKTSQNCRIGVSIDVSSADVCNNDSKSTRIARTPCKRPRPVKLNRGLSQGERTYGHGSSGSVSQCGRKGGGT